MSTKMATATPVIDCHAHLWNPDSIANLNAICDQIGFGRMNIVCTFNRDAVNLNPAAFAAKARFPERFYVFAGLDHTAYYSGGKIAAPSLAAQADRLIALGADGIKMLEAKPTSRKSLDIPVDSPYFEEYFCRVEAAGLPLLWHVADPEEFWDPDKTPAWAKEHGWGYDESFVRKAQLYREVGNVLERHPQLQVIFAHFYFRSADLPLAAALLDRFAGVHFDLAPGIEMFYNMSRDPDAAREFFIKYADRILFGTDIWSEQSGAEAALRAGIVTRWLESADEYRVPSGADFLLGPPEDGIMRGLALPPEVLARIYARNFERLAGCRPKPLHRELAAQECERIAHEIRALTGKAVEETYSAAAAAYLRGAA